ncbi:MAG: hypothetical protein QOF94_2201 [Acidobacteriaceae bacterium]
MSKQGRSKTSQKKQPARTLKPKPKKVRQQPHKESIQPDPELIVFERAIALFNAGRFQSAKDAFAELTVARNRDLAHSATLRIRMCEQRLAPLDNPTE